MFELRNRGKLDPNTLAEFDYLTGRLRELFSDVVTDDGQLITPVSETAWTTPDLDANNFFGLGGQTWTVSKDTGQVTYKLIGKTMILSFFISGAQLGGTPTSNIYMRIPEGKVAAKTIRNLAMGFDNGNWTIVNTVVAANTSFVDFFRMDVANWTNGGMFLFGEIIFEVM